MKKFLLVALAFAVCLFSVNFCSAAKANVCDFGIDTFINRYNDFANQNNNSYFSENPQKMKSNDKFDYYGVTLNAPAKIIFIFNVGKDGCIASFSMSNYLQNNGENFSAALLDALSTIGASLTEIAAMTEVLEKNPAASKFIASINRDVFVVYQTSNGKAGPVQTFNLFAMK